MRTIILLPLLLPLLISKVDALFYGVANTPPMGWSSWMVLGCNNDCTNSINSPMCFSEKTLEQIADVMSSGGFLEAGYEYIILDDCWQSRHRENNKLVADHVRFPRGIGGLAEHLHRKGLKLGIFSDLGPFSGQRYPGSHGFLEEDANTFVSWNVDYVKMSAYTCDAKNLDKDYTDFGNYLAKSSRQIVYAVSWPVYMPDNRPKDYNAVRKVAHTWRFSGDVGPNWGTLLSVLDHYAREQVTLANVAGFSAGRGGWNDPDVLLVGHHGLTFDQAKVQMAVWCIMAAPLIISSDIRHLEYQHRAILLNRDAIAINQDPLGLPGYRMPTRDDNVDIWVRKISPFIDGHYSYAIAFVNRNINGPTTHLTITLGDLKMNNAKGYFLKEVFHTDTNSQGKIMYPATTLSLFIKPASVVFYKAEIQWSQSTDDSARTVMNNLPEILRYGY